jgi:tRNA A-37 threonylcarbamoyl transferase component Bud32
MAKKRDFDKRAQTDDMLTFSLEGQTLGKYRVLEPLGRGGMARVYRAYHPRLERYVAIKVLRPDLTDTPTFQARFQREARAVAALRHPNIVQVFDFDVQDEISYMVMELLEGDSLQTRLADYRVRGECLSWGEIARILFDVLDGLDYAHSEGMIHRDIKPGNILLTKRGEAVIADFGIAHIVGGTRHTASGALMGTLDYMAPEQGLENRSDARSDIYSLGIVCYEMLTQRTPFAADTPLAVLMKHLNDPLPLPHTLNPNIPKPYERIVLKALSKDPEDRYQSAAEMAQALGQAVETLELKVPMRVKKAVAFTTAEAPAESVAVLSGAKRHDTSAAAVAQDETDVTLGERLNAEADAAHPAERRKTSVGRLILISLLIIGLVNLTMLTTAMLFNSWAAFRLGWPVELWLVGASLAFIMMKTERIWLVMPLGILLGNAVLLTYTSLSSSWEQWNFLWILEVWIIGGAIVAPFLIRRFSQHPRELSSVLGRVSLGISLFISIVVPPLSTLVYLLTT